MLQKTGILDLLNWLVKRGVDEDRAVEIAQGRMTAWNSMHAARVARNRRRDKVEKAGRKAAHKKARTKRIKRQRRNRKAAGRA